MTGAPRVYVGGRGEWPSWAWVLLTLQIVTLTLSMLPWLLQAAIPRTAPVRPVFLGPPSQQFIPPQRRPFQPPSGPQQPGPQQPAAPQPSR